MTFLEKSGKSFRTFSPEKTSTWEVLDEFALEVIWEDCTPIYGVASTGLSQTLL